MDREDNFIEFLGIFVYWKNPSEQYLTISSNDSVKLYKQLYKKLYIRDFSAFNFGRSTYCLNS